MDIVFHYPPELFQLLVDAIPLLCPRKKDVLLFFRGAGVGADISAAVALALQRAPQSMNKFQMVSDILTRLNERGEQCLRERREVLRRVVEFEDFSTCWADDQLKAKGLISDIRRVVNVKDSFTRIELERERERGTRVAAAQALLREKTERTARLRSIHRDLLALFNERNHQKRGTVLEGILNRLFKENGILVSEAFAIRAPDGAGVVEQIDGVIQFDGQHYLVEMKWWQEPLGVHEVSQHLSRVFFRGHVRGMVISASGYSDPAVMVCRDALQKSVIVLGHLREIVLILEGDLDLRQWLKEKIDAAIIFRNPLHTPPMLSGSQISV